MVFLLVWLRRGRLMPKGLVTKMEELPADAEREALASIVTDGRNLLSELVRAGLSAASRGDRAIRDAIREQAALGRARLRFQAGLLGVPIGLAVLWYMPRFLVHFIDVCIEIA